MQSIIISASRMTDMPAFYPNNIIRETEKRKEKGFTIHTLLLWTKHPESLFREPLHSYLSELKKENTQLYIQLTITGMGRDCFVSGFKTKKVYMEPCVPNYEESIQMIDKVSELTENPLRIRLRIDPIIRLVDWPGQLYSNLGLFKPIVREASKKGIKNITFSFLENGMHAKVNKRFKEEHIEIFSPTNDEREKMALWVSQIEKEYSVQISSCCVPQLKESACIDGNLLQQLHNHHLEVTKAQPRSRTLCGCSKSIDIGGWPPAACNSGCLYCYSHPVI